MGTLGDIVDRIEDELARTDLTSQITNAVKSAINQYAGEPWWFNEVVSYTITTTSSVEFYPLPADFEDIETFAIKIGDSFVDLEPQHYDTLQNWQTGLTFGQPTDYAIYSEQVEFYPIPISSLVTVMSYNKALTSLSATTDTNTFLSYGEELIRARARADVQMNILRDDLVTQEYLICGQQGLPFYSFRERAAYQQLRSRSTRRVATNYLRGGNW